MLLWCKLQLSYKNVQECILSKYCIFFSELCLYNFFWMVAIYVKKCLPKCKDYGCFFNFLYGPYEITVYNLQLCYLYWTLILSTSSIQIQKLSGQIKSQKFLAQLSCTLCHCPLTAAYKRLHFLWTLSSYDVWIYISLHSSVITKVY
jgi:hypothetical protein